MLFQKVIYGNIVNKVIYGNIVNMMLKLIEKMIEHFIYNNGKALTSPNQEEIIGKTVIFYTSTETQHTKTNIGVSILSSLYIYSNIVCEAANAPLAPA